MRLPLNCTVGDRLRLVGANAPVEPHHRAAGLAPGRQQLLQHGNRLARGLGAQALLREPAFGVAEVVLHVDHDQRAARQVDLDRLRRRVGQQQRPRLARLAHEARRASPCSCQALCTAGPKMPRDSGIVGANLGRGERDGGFHAEHMHPTCHNALCFAALSRSLRCRNGNGDSGTIVATSHRMNHLRLLRYVDEVARVGSIRQAAERLHVAPSAVNRRIQDIEDELGTPIFERLPRGMRLTAAGELFVRYIRSRAADLERVQSEIEELQGLRRGRVRIVASQALAPRFLPGVISAFRASHPLVAFDVRIGDHVQAAAALRGLETDLALVFNLAPEADIERSSVVEQKLMAIMHSQASAGSAQRHAALQLREVRRLPRGAAEPRHRRPATAGALSGAQLHQDARDGGEQLASSSCAAAWTTASRSRSRWRSAPSHRPRHRRARHRGSRVSEGGDGAGELARAAAAGDRLCVASV